ncbi:MAG: MgtC/SapB family protein [Myxococcota bacterium]
MSLDPLIFRNFAIALFLGALVGLDREHHASARPSFGGLRTFLLISLAGATSTWLGPLIGAPWLVGVALAGLCAWLAVAYAVTSPEQGMTTTVAAVIVFLTGAACAAGQVEVAVVVGIATSAVLAFKAPLHGLATAVGPEDLASGLKLLFATFVVLPLLPDTAVDPWGVWIPYRLWWLVVAISGLSLLGYAAVRVLGARRGMALTGLFGGLVSSTAVTLSAARQSVTSTWPDALAMSVSVAWATMFARVALELAVLNPALLPQVGPPLVAMGAVTGAAAVWFGTRHPDGDVGPPMALVNPFSLWEAVKFGALFAAVLLAVEAARRFLDPRALYAVAAIAGTTDVDAITLSLAEQAHHELAAGVAAGAVVVASISNTVVKLGLAVSVGSRPFAVRLAGVAAGAVVAALVAAAVVW